MTLSGGAAGGDVAGRSIISLSSRDGDMVAIQQTFFKCNATPDDDDDDDDQHNVAAGQLLTNWLVGCKVDE